MASKPDRTVAIAEFIQKSFHYIATAILALYLTCAYFVRELNESKLEKPFLGSTLLLLLVAATVHAAGLSKSQNDLESIKDDIAKLAQGSCTRVSLHQGRSVYEQATALVKASRERVWVTYLRKEGPTRGVAADNYFQECRKWAFESEDHDFRRIILRAAEPEIEEFCRQELVSIKQAARSNHKYRAKVLKSSFDWGEPLGIGIYDDVVFITYREAGEQVTGISLHSAELANGYFGRYFDSLWSPRCADHLQDVLK